MKNLFKTSAMMAFLSLAVAGTFTSCSSEENVSGEGGNAKMLTIKVTPANSVDTRAATTGDITKATENQINNVAYAVFGTDGNIVGSVKEATATPAGITATFADGNLTEGAKVIVAANCPASKFASVTTEEGFKQVTLTAAEAIYQDGTGDKAVNNKIPMYGEGYVSSNGTKDLTADVFVYHLISKVTLASLTVDLNSSTATFQPTEIFLANVPNVVNVKQVYPSANYAYPTTVESYLSGEQSTEGNPKYLSTEALSWEASTAGANKSYTDGLPTFYTTPNDKTTDGDNGATFLVIKGQYKEGSSEAVTKYYPVYINYNTSNKSAARGTAKTLEPNVNYKLNVTLKGSGSDTPTNPQNLANSSVNVKAVDFTDVNATFTYDDDVKIGDYLFNDGKWGPIVASEVNEAHHPVAVIFANKTSQKDIEAGYSHGYAVAIASCGHNLQWATNDASKISSWVTDGTTAPTLSVENVNAVTGDLDGLTESKAIAALSDYGTTKAETKYPSVYYAMNFGKSEIPITVNPENPTNYNDAVCSDGEEGSTSGFAMAEGSNTSGWYLGSIGQYYLVAKNLGGNLDNTDWSIWGSQESGGWFKAGTSLQNLTKLNELFKAAGDANTTAGVQNASDVPMLLKLGNGSYSTWYWTSSEFSASHGFGVYWGGVGNFNLGGNDAKSNTINNNRGVRPVIAF